MDKNFKEQVIHAALTCKLGAHSSGGVVSVPGGTPPEEEINIGSTIPISLSNELSDVCAILGMTRRAFLRLAVRTAVHDAKVLIDEVDVFEHAKPAQGDLTLKEVFEDLSPDEQDKVLAKAVSDLRAQA